MGKVGRPGRRQQASRPVTVATRRRETHQSRESGVQRVARSPGPPFVEKLPQWYSSDLLGHVKRMVAGMHDVKPL